MTAEPSASWALPVLLALVAGVVIAFFVLVDPIPQDLAYHAFVDARALLSVPNFWNVVSNLPFLFVGLWGMNLASSLPDPELRLPFIIFFIGVLLTAFGSSYYHLAPGNETLFWDRLPMTIAFAGLFAAVIGEYYSRPAAKPLAGIFLVVGIASVVYWQLSESRGAGDLRPYAVVQFLPMIATPLILLTRGARSKLTRYFWAMIGFYVAAKLFEYFDVAVYVAELISGHSLKHVIAAAGPAALALGLKRIYATGTPIPGERHAEI